MLTLFTDVWKQGHRSITSRQYGSSKAWRSHARTQTLSRMRLLFMPEFRSVSFAPTSRDIVIYTRIYGTRTAQLSCPMDRQSDPLSRAGNPRPNKRLAMSSEDVWYVAYASGAAAGVENWEAQAPPGLPSKGFPAFPQSWMRRSIAGAVAGGPGIGTLSRGASILAALKCHVLRAEHHSPRACSALRTVLRDLRNYAGRTSVIICPCRYSASTPL